MALKRMATAAHIGVNVAIEYKRTMSRKYTTEEDRLLAKSECDLKCASKVLTGLLKLGGIYVKLGQHVSAMNYILPIEWTSTLAVLQDRCDPSSRDDIRHMFLTDYGQPMEDVFDEFEWVPLGVASLAQVHKAKLKANGEWVAVKFQHPRLDAFYQVDLGTVSFIVTSIKRLFPNFGFEWIMEEMQESLPQELDFELEAKNAMRVKQNFAQEYANQSTCLVIPDVIWAKRRILCMEFIEGARIDDFEFMDKHGIDSSQVSTEITKIFSKMMFLDGFVHCDPHPGNILIRPAKHPHQSHFNFDLVLLDHGLYRTLTHQLRTDYAHLWTSLIRGDEDGIRQYALCVGCRPQSHRLFASLLTGREWHTIQAAELSSVRSNTEVKRVTGRATGFLGRIYDILETLPRIVLLLLKTSDLLRGLDETLRVSKDKYITYAVMGRYCALAVWNDAKTHLFKRIGESTGLAEGWKWVKDLIGCWWEYQSLEYGLWFYQLHVSVKERLLGRRHHHRHHHHHQQKKAVIL
ncbi:ABC1-domain-containing protein [Backusella circina FSU 941]|nr:ABC1-domain-containing protein [Backusella circina FSU 941]